MKVYNSKIEGSDFLAELLAQNRIERNFKAEQYIKSKALLINDYYEYSGLNAAIVAVSGGVDSAVVLALVCEASKQVGSPIKKIVPLLLPAFEFDGATNQNGATSQAEELCKQLGLTPRIFPRLTTIAGLISSSLDEILDEKSTPWSRGQLVAYARTPIIYNTASILTDNGFPALVVGTTNLSEGGYLGYVGKASDGLVDLQVISDLYKSEVYEVAQALNIPAPILEATPTGDMYDARSDEEVFGVSYDFVELYQEWLQGTVKSEIDLMENEVFAASASNLEALHKYNAHKYLIGSPSIHLDLRKIAIPNGWHNTPWRQVG